MTLLHHDWWADSLSRNCEGVRGTTLSAAAREEE